MDYSTQTEINQLRDGCDIAANRTYTQDLYPTGEQLKHLTKSLVGDYSCGSCSLFTSAASVVYIYTAK